MHGVLRCMLKTLNAYCISRRPVVCLKARKMDDNERAAKKIAKRQLRYQQLLSEGSATSPNGGPVLAPLASVSTTRMESATTPFLTCCWVKMGSGSRIRRRGATNVEMRFCRTFAISCTVTHQSYESSCADKSWGYSALASLVAPMTFSGHNVRGNVSFLRCREAAYSRRSRRAPPTRGGYFSLVGPPGRLSRQRHRHARY